MRSRREDDSPSLEARFFPTTPSGAEIGRSDCELADTGFTAGEDVLPTGLSDGDEPEVDARGLWADTGPEIRRSPLADTG